MKVGVIGSGAWGTAVGNLMAANGHEVLLYVTNQQVYEDIRRERINRQYLPELKLEPNLQVTLCRDELENSECVVWATPVQYLRSRAIEFKECLPRARLFINLAKGLEAGTYMRPSEILSGIFAGANTFGSLAGPNIASEVARGQFTETTVAIERTDHDDLLRGLFCRRNFRLNIQRDLAGLEFVGAFKNVSAIIGGTCDASAMGDNAKSLLVARSWCEAATVAGHFGASGSSFYSVTAISDLYATAHSREGRNRRVGEALGAGQSLSTAVAGLGGRVAEGVETARILVAMAKTAAVDAPLTRAIGALIDGSVTVPGYWDLVF
jgi:glycerol-3-phosphate dehydrogenase (NAD(P)+)